MASLNGCMIPDHEGLFGPFRACVIPKILRSYRVKNATFSNTGIQIIIKFINIDIFTSASSGQHFFELSLYLNYAF